MIGVETPTLTSASSRLTPVSYTHLLEDDLVGAFERALTTGLSATLKVER